MNCEMENALAHIAKKASGKKRIVFVSGNFNIIHPGHLRLIRFAAECGDYLVVGVHGEGWEDAHIPEGLRLEGVRSIELVNYAFILREPPEKFIELLKPAVVVKGKEHESQANPEQAAVETYGGKLLFGSGDIRFSSLDLIRKEFRESNLSTIVKPLDFPERHQFSLDQLRTLLPKFSSLRVAVIGDLIVDEYITCDPLGMSQEDPTIVVTPVMSDKFVGGAGIVAAHAKGLGAQVRYFSVVGKDPTAEFARERLDSQQVQASFFEDETRPTTLKQRYRANGKTLLRVSHLKQHDISKDLIAKLKDTIVSALPKTDLLVFSDFNYGCMPQSLVESVARACQERGVLMVADSQSSSQVGDVSRFKDMLLLTPTEREARLAVRDFNSGLVILAEKLRKQARTRNVVVTLGAEGLLVHASNPLKRQAWMTDQLPALNTAPKDTAGAGDSFLTACSMSLAVGADIWSSTYFGALAAACQVGRVGNTPLTPRDIEAEIGT